MSKKVYFINVQPDPSGPVLGRVWDVEEFQKLQDYAHGHIEQIVKSLLMNNAATAVVDGFEATLTSGLEMTIAPGSAFHATNGKTYDLADAQTVELGTADPTHARIDYVYALIETDAQAELEFRPFRQWRTNPQLAAGVPLYPQDAQNVPTELHTRATINIKAGTPASVPAAPALAANEIPLFRVHVAAGQLNLAGGDLTDARNHVRSLADAWSQLDNLSELVDDRVAVLITDDTYLTKSYDDAGNLLHLDVDTTALREWLDDRVAVLIVPDSGLSKNYDDAGNLLHIAPDFAVLDARFVNTTGDQMTGSLGVYDQLAVQQNPVGLPLPNGTNNHHTGLRLSNLYDVNNVTEIIEFVLGGFLTGKIAQYRAGGSSGTNTDQQTEFIFSAYHVNAMNEMLRLRGSGSHVLTGNLNITGSLSKGSGTFLIDHPLHPDEKDLVHAFVESPRDTSIYNGAAIIPAGETVFDVDIDAACGMESGVFALITQNAGALVQCRGFIKAWGEVLPGTGTLRIHLQEPSNGEVFNWFVSAERADAFIKQADGHTADGHLLVERPKVANPNQEELLAPQLRVVKASAPAADREETEVVRELVGTLGFARHADVTGVGTSPLRQVTVRTVVEQDEEGGTPRV
jgi:hypothetical protein